MPSVKIVERMDISGILEFVNDNKDKIGNSGLLLQKEKTKICRMRNVMQRLRFFYIFRKRVCNFSLGSRLIGQPDFFGPIRKVALRSEDYAWAPVLGSFDKLRVRPEKISISGKRAKS